MYELTEAPQLEKYLAEQLQEFETSKRIELIKKDIEFESKLRELLSTYGYSLKDVVNFLKPF